MKVYKIKVNGKSYRVELEAIDEVASAAPAAASAPAPSAPKPDAIPAAKPSGEGNPVTSPIQGQVTKVLVKVGDQVKKGQAVVIVEAMKLENEVVSSVEGEVVAILVEKGTNVAAKDVLIRVR